MLDLSPETPQFYVQKSQELLDLGNVDLAIAEIEKALEIDVNYVYALKELATIYEQEARLDLALEYRQQIVELQPTNHSAYDDVSKVLMAQGRIEDAILVYKKSLAVSEAPIFIYLGLAKALEQTGQLRTAIALYQYTSKLFPDNQELETSWLRASNKQNQLEEHHMNLVAAPKQQSIQPYSYFFQQGRELISQANYEQAIAIYAEGNKQHPHHPFSYFMLGNAYGLVGNYAQELDFYYQAVQLDLSNFKLNLAHTEQSYSTLNDNQINSIYQKIVKTSLNAQQTQDLPQLIEVANQRLCDYSFFLETARELANLDKFEEAIAFLEEAQSKSNQLDSACLEKDEIEYLLVSLKQAQENRNVVQDCHYKIISLGSNSLPAAISTTWGLKPSQHSGELTCPFDLALHPYESVVEAIETDFNNYLHRDYLVSIENSSDSNETFFCVKNIHYNCVFTEERGEEFADNNFAKLIDIYRQRISNFYHYINSSPVLFLLYSEQPISTERLVKAISSKFPKLDFKVMLILSDNDPASSSMNTDQNIISYQVSDLDQYSKSSTQKQTIAYEQKVSNKIKKVIIDNF